MKKVLALLVLLALIAGPATAATWENVRAASGSEYTVSVTGDGSNYEVHVSVVPTGNAGLASVGVTLSGASSYVCEVPMLTFLDPVQGYKSFNAGFTLLRSTGNPISGSQDTMNTTVTAGADLVPVYGFGQTAGNLLVDLMPVGCIPTVQIPTGTAYAANLLVGSGTYSGDLPTVSESNMVVFVPEPATMSLLGLGSLVALLRRKK